MSSIKPDRITVKKEDGEWIAVVYRNGKRDEACTYYSGGDDAEAKDDAERTANAMRTNERSFTKMDVVPDNFIPLNINPESN